MDGGSLVRVTVQGAATDPELAGAWHSLLVQLDLYLAAGIVAPLPAGTFDDIYG